MPLSGEREILDGELELCLADPTNIPVRLLLIETLGTLTTSNPQATQEFQPKFQRLLTQHPIPPPRRPLPTPHPTPKLNPLSQTKWVPHLNPGFIGLRWGVSLPPHDHLANKVGAPVHPTASSSVT